MSDDTTVRERRIQNHLKKIHRSRGKRAVQSGKLSSYRFTTLTDGIPVFVSQLTTGIHCESKELVKDAVRDLTELYSVTFEEISRMVEEAGYSKDKWDRLNGLYVRQTSAS